jgi:hypothetical protein
VFLLSLPRSNPPTNFQWHIITCISLLYHSTQLFSYFKIYKHLPSIPSPFIIHPFQSLPLNIHRLLLPPLKRLSCTPATISSYICIHLNFAHFCVAPYIWLEGRGKAKQKTTRQKIIALTQSCDLLTRHREKQLYEVVDSWHKRFCHTHRRLRMYFLLYEYHFGTKSNYS